jgi:Flp pilus assembly protein CpaB
LRRRSNLLVLLGLASFVLGLLAVYLFTKDDDNGGGGTAENTVQVIVAGTNLSAGTNGDQIITDQSYRLEAKPTSQVTPDMLTAPSQLSGTVLTLTFAEGEPIRLSGLRSLGTGIRPPIPEGYEALTVATPFVAGGAQTINPGDRVNVYLVLPAQNSGGGASAAQPYQVPRAELLLANVPILDVQVGTSPLTVNQAADPSSTSGAQQTASGGSLVFVVAVDTLDAEKVIFGETAGNLYFSRVRLDDQGNPPDPIDSTPGRDFLNILEEEAQAALDRQTPIP